MDRRGFLAGSLGAGTLIWLAPSIVLAAPDASLADFAGAWRYVGGSKERAKAQKSIDESVEALTVFKKIARKRLEESCMPDAVIGMKASDAQLTIVRPGVPVIRGEVNGSSFKWKNPYGDRINIRLKLSGRSLKVRFFDGASDTRKSYSLNEAGDRFVVKTSIDHERMPVGVRYRYTYKLGA